MPDWLQALDGAILLWLQEVVRGPLLTVFFTWYTALGNAGLIWIVLSLGLLCFRRTRRAGAASLLALMIGALCTNVILKQLVQRPRPWLKASTGSGTGITALRRPSPRKSAAVSHGEA